MNAVLPLLATLGLLLLLALLLDPLDEDVAEQAEAAATDDGANNYSRLSAAAHIIAAVAIAVAVTARPAA
eukprot:CAMPEP_0170466668 /NCGR_PEP_ID=MMETSP0123-20130129/10538_1 /TAXON_ID=182087 /ORGANISM="Favella ehrenbergii, Strain Fehren 1" /LENGTH=69 /DNA_ID=CAMNT_0010732847 /DNA_START=606 /DNA_END=815 /DNA_ORIENTATION=-